MNSLLDDQSPSVIKRSHHTGSPGRFAAAVAAGVCIAFTVVLSHSSAWSSTELAARESSACKHFYIELGTNNGGSLVDFISKGSEQADGQMRSVIKFREDNNLDVKDFCVYGFEPNPLHSELHMNVTREMGGRVKKLKIFSESVAGITDGFTQLFLDPPQHGAGNGFPSWGSSVMEKHVQLSDPGANTTKVKVASINFVRWMGELMATQASGDGGKVIVRVDIEGSEYVLLPEMVSSGILCQHVDKLEVEWHPRAISPNPTCLAATIQWMLSSENCRTQWPASHGKVCDDLWGLRGQFHITKE